jgi:hypothetical protein
MKVKIILISALAAATAWVSCTETNEQGTPALNAPKSVTLTIANQTGTTRATADALTPSDAIEADRVAVARAEDLYALFATADGTLVSTVKIIDPANEDITVSGDTYTFHKLGRTVAKVVITNASTAAAATKAAVAATYDDMEDLQVPLGNGIPVYGESRSFQLVVGSTDAHDTDGDGIDEVYELYNAGEIEVLPLLARIEIAGIQCSDLGLATAGANGLPPRYGRLELGSIGIHNTRAAFAPTAARISYDKSTFLDPANPDLDTEAEADAAALAAWEAARPTAWNTDALAAGTVFDAATDIYDQLVAEDGVFFYNVFPSEVPNIILEITGGQWNTNLGVNTPASDPQWPAYVRTTALQGITQFDAGHIYQVAFNFTCEDIKPWVKPGTLICVVVDVTIPNWVVEEALKPTYL